MNTPINIYMIGILISFVMFTVMFESHPEEVSKLFRIKEKFHYKWILLFSFMVSVFWVVMIPILIWCKTNENE